MARRTKEDALATRHQLLDAAERVFAQKGVSHTSLQDIALAAGATRGAIYWHFKNKADLFNAMMERITLPMETALHHMEPEAGRDPLDVLCDPLLDVMRQVATDERTQRVFEVATLMVEYVDELQAVRARHLQSQMDTVQHMRLSLLNAARRRGQRLPVTAFVAAQGLHALVVGLISSWLLAPQSFDLVAVAQTAINAYLQGLGLTRVGCAPT
jgi:TetR/AcrR family acrAB operon transcriptional repressor